MLAQFIYFLYLFYTVIDHNADHAGQRSKITINIHNNINFHISDQPGNNNGNPSARTYTSEEDAEEEEEQEDTDADGNSDDNNNSNGSGGSENGDDDDDQTSNHGSSTSSQQGKVDKPEVAAQQPWQITSYEHLLLFVWVPSAS